MSIENDIKQKSFKNAYQKVAVNLMYTDSWLLNNYSQILKPYNLSEKQYFVLKILVANHPSPASVNFIIERMLDKMSNVSRLIDKLVEKNLVIKVKSLSDRRSMDILLTNEGFFLIKKIEAQLTHWEKKMVCLSEEELSILNNLLNKVREC